MPSKQLKRKLSGLTFYRFQDFPNKELCDLALKRLRSGNHSKVVLTRVTKRKSRYTIWIK